jgi:HK97 family phage portal protein
MTDPVRLPSGLLVTDRRRSLDPPDPLGLPPRADVTPNTNPAVGSVGPNVPVAGDLSAQQQESGGFGATHVLYPAASPPVQASAWAGWPSEWSLPNTSSVAGALWSETDIVWSAIDKNATATADMPVETLRGVDRVASRSWLTNPNPQVYTSWAEFWRQYWRSYQTAGEAFVLATSWFADGYPATFALLSPWLVTVELDGLRRRYYIGSAELSPEEILHVRYETVPNEPRGVGPLAHATDRLVAARALLRYSTDVSANGGRPWGVLKHKYELTEDQAHALQGQWLSAAVTRHGAPAVLDQDTDLQVVQVLPKDMLLSEIQTNTDSRLAALLGVPPYLLGIESPAGSSLTYTNVTSLLDFWWRVTLRPQSHYLTAALSGWTLPYGTELSLDARQFLQPDELAQAQVYEILLRAGVVDVGEVRAALRLPALGAPTLSDTTPTGTPVPVGGGYS